MAYGPRFPEGPALTGHWYTLTIDFSPERDEDGPDYVVGDFDNMDRVAMSKALGQYIAYKLTQSIDEDVHFMSNFVVKNLTIEQHDFVTDDQISAWLNSED